MLATRKMAAEFLCVEGVVEAKRMKKRSHHRSSLETLEIGLKLAKRSRHNVLYLDYAIGLDTD